MSLPVLQRLQISDLIAHAGGDPWAVDDSLQAGSPTQINFLAQAFHQAAGSATAAEETFQTAEQHFQQYHRENGEQPINNGAEVHRVKDGLHATKEQLGRIAADLETIAGALAQARSTSGDQIEALNSQLQEYDAYLDDYLTNYDTYRREGYDIDAYIQQCREGAATDTQTVFSNVSLIRQTYSRALRQALTNLRVKDGYDPDIAVRNLDADNTPYGADGGTGTRAGSDGAATDRTGTDAGVSGNGSAINGNAHGTDGGPGALGNTPDTPVDGRGGDGGGAALPSWLIQPGVRAVSQPGKPKAPSEPLITFDSDPLGNLGDGLKAAADEAKPWIRGGQPVPGALDEIGRVGKAFGWGGVSLDLANAGFEIDARMNDGASFPTAVADVAPGVGAGLVGGWAGAGMGAEAGAEAGAVIGSFIVPGAGTAVGAIAGAGIGALVGGITGSRLGSAVGDAASNISHGIWHSLFG